MSNFLTTYNGWITETSHHSSSDNGRFFMRREIHIDSLPFNLDGFCQTFTPIVHEFSMEWRITDFKVKKHVVLVASRESYYLAGLLYRWHNGELECEISYVIANRGDPRSMVEWHGIPYFHVPVDPQDKQLTFDEASRLVDEHGIDYIILAHYMQVLPPDLCRKYAHQVISIYYGSLSLFIDAKPYHQAPKCGVKLIDAASHYVTKGLDADPITEQGVVRVIHHDNIEDMARLDKDVERLVLTCGLRYHLEDYILVHDDKTVVFD